MEESTIITIINALITLMQLLYDFFNREMRKRNTTLAPAEHSKLVQEVAEVVERSSNTPRVGTPIQRKEKETEK